MAIVIIMISALLNAPRDLLNLAFEISAEYVSRAGTFLSDHPVNNPKRPVTSFSTKMAYRIERGIQHITNMIR
jgi:hypothetical protein